MRLTNQDGETVDTDAQSDSVALFLEKLADLKAHCVAHRIPLYACGVSPGNKMSTAHSFEHPTLLPTDVSLLLLGVAQRWWADVFPNYRLALVPKSLLDTEEKPGEDVPHG